ncbi:MAG: DUF1127 domain-containing protein [Pseudomonadaceae bacterium]|nr:DUF1127 domain-containing protein [Pseudomonadaceae bacterium]
MHSSPLTDRAEPVAVAGSAGLALRLLASLLARLQTWRQNSRTRRQLAQLDTRQLADTGITQAERGSELDKPFWR